MMDSLDFLQKAWVAEAMLLLVYLCFAWWLMPPERLNVMVAMLPSIVAIIGGQGVAGAAGPAVKRVLENKKAEIETKKKRR